jgi:hypothetical protein
MLFAASDRGGESPIEYLRAPTRQACGVIDAIAVARREP